jgi:hypothetical protein
MITRTDIDDLTGASLLDSTYNEVGKIGRFLVDRLTGDPSWATVRSDSSGTNDRLVPLAQAERAGNAVRVPYESSAIKAAPAVVPDHDHVKESDERALYAYYGLDYAETRSDSGLASGQALGTRGQASDGYQHD